MTPDIPKTTKQWNVTSNDGKDRFGALKYSEQKIAELGDSEVLVKRKSPSHYAAGPLANTIANSTCCLSKCKIQHTPSL